VKWRRAVLFVATLVVLVLLWQLAARRGEPRYKGRTLTYWLAVHQKAPLNSAESQEAAEAIQQIGTNALPYLMARLTSHTSSWRLRMASTAERLPGPNHWVTKLLLGEEDRLVAADDGFTLLGAQAVPAVPELLRMLSGKETWDVAIVALQDIGEGAVPDLIAALTNRANPLRIRAGAAQALGSVGTNSSVVAVLVACLQDDPHVANQAAAALGRLQREPQIAVPALVGVAQKGLQPIREQALWAVGEFGTNAQCAMPMLTNLLTDPDPRIRGVTTNVLESIAPELLGTNAVAEKQE
jgi:HEAT repeat protein